MTTSLPMRGAVALIAWLALAGAAQAGPPDLDLGEPSVLSQRGQRLKLALPYGSAPGERVSATRFEIVSVVAPDGWRAPEPGAFTIAKPARRNLVFLQSDEPVDAPELTVTVRIADQPQAARTWRIVVPPARDTASADGGSAPAAARGAAPAVRAPGAERLARTDPTRR